MSAKKAYTINGTVTDKQTGAGIPNLTVEAWDKDLVIDDLLGNTTTDDDGQFSLSFGKAHYSEICLDRKPDVYFKVFREGTLVASTEDSVLWNVSKKKTKVKIAVSLEGSPPSDPSVPGEETEKFIEGRVTYEDGMAGDGMSVKAFRVVLRDEEEIGSGTANAAAYFRIEPALSEALLTETPAVDVRVRAYDDAGEMRVQSRIIRPALGQTHVDLVVPGKHPSSGFDRVTGSITPHLGDIAIEDIDPNPDSEDMQYLREKTKVEPERLERMVRANQLAKAGDVEPDLVYALLDQGVPANLPSLLLQKPSVLTGMLKSAAASGVIPETDDAVLAEKVDDLQTKLSSRALVNRAPGELPLADWMDAADVDASLQAKYLERYVRHEGTPAELWEALAADPAFEGQVEPIRLAVDIGHLTSNYVPLVEKLQVLVSAHDMSRLDDMAELDPEVIRNVFDDCTEPLPDEGLNIDEETRRGIFIEGIVDTLKRRFPTPYAARGINQEPSFDASLIRTVMANNPDWRPQDGVSCHLNWAGLDDAERTAAWQALSDLSGEVAMFPSVDGETLLQDGPSGGLKNPKRAITRHFLSEAPDFNILTTHIDRYIDQAQEAGTLPGDDPDTVREVLKPLQRVMRVTGDYDSAAALMSQGLDSAMAIATVSEKTFLKKYGAAFPSAEKAHDAYLQASGTQALQMNILAALADAHVSPAMTATGDADVEELPGSPNLTRLFGSLNLCDCDHCESLYSPSAYFVDLMQFLRRESETAYEALILRRPDLEHILLTCENSQTPMPYVDLVNEILEASVELGELTPGPANNTVEITAAELAANPQYIKEQAYATLKTAVTAPALPFDLFLEISRRYLAHLGCSRSEAMRVFQDIHDVPDHAAIDLEYLEISPEEKSIIEGAAEGVPNLTREYFGYFEDTILYFDEQNEEIDENWDENLSRVPVFLQRTGLEYSDLLALLETRVINPVLDPLPPEGVALYSPKEDCDIDQIQIRHQDLSDLEASTWRRIHRFLRLWKKSGLEMRELDKAISVLDPQGTLATPFLQSLAALRRLSITLRLETVEFLAFWSPIDTAGEEALYHRLFLNRKVTNPVSEAFTLLPDGSELASTTEKLADHAAAIMSALGLSDDDLADFRKLTGLDDENVVLNLDHLSQLYRHVRLAKRLRLKAWELESVMVLTGIDPFSSPLDTVLFVEQTTALKSAPLKVRELSYLYRHVVDPKRNIAPVKEDAVQWLEGLQQGLQTISKENQPAPDPEGNLLREKLGHVLPAEDLDMAMAVIDGASPLAPPDVDTFIDTHFAVFVDAAGAKQALGGSSSLEVPERRGFILTPLLAYLKDELMRRLVKQSLADELDLDAAVVQCLVEQLLVSGQQSNQVLIADFLALGDDNATLTPEDCFDAYVRLHKIAILVNEYEISKEELVRFSELGQDFGGFDLNTLPLEASSNTDAGAPGLYAQWQLLDAFYRIRKAVPETDTNLISVFDAPNADDAVDALCQAAGWDASAVEFLQSQDGLDLDTQQLKDPRWWVRIRDALERSKKLGASVEQVRAWVTTPPDQAQAEDLIRTVKAKYDDDEWDQKAKLLRDRIREKQREALVAYLLALWAQPEPPGPELFKTEAGTAVAVLQHKLNQINEGFQLVVSSIYDDATEQAVMQFQSDQNLTVNGKVDAQVWNNLTYLTKPIREPNDLYAHFLIDVEMSPCMMTSRLKQAISSVQLFVQRCLMNLESRVSPTVIDGEQWEWMKNYRVWEANRKVFLYPENWIEPELRDNKTPFFKELESQLLQGEINEENVERALKDYVQKLNTVANLEICALYRQRRKSFLAMKGLGYTVEDVDGETDDPSEAPTDTSDHVIAQFPESDDLLHVFGRTTEAPFLYFHRTWDLNTGEWAPWQQLDLDIEAGETGVHLIPAEWKGRMYLFWPVFQEAEYQVDDDRVPDDLARTQQWKIKMAWSEYRYGRWQPNHISSESVESPPYVDCWEEDPEPQPEVWTSKFILKIVVYLPSLEDHIFSVQIQKNGRATIKVHRRFSTVAQAFEIDTLYFILKDEPVEKDEHWGDWISIGEYTTVGDFDLPGDNGKIKANSDYNKFYLSQGYAYNAGFKNVKNFYNWQKGSDNLSVYKVGWDTFSQVLKDVPANYQLRRANRTTTWDYESLRPFTYQDLMRIYLALPWPKEDVNLLKFHTLFHPYAQHYFNAIDGKGVTGLLRLENQTLNDEKPVTIQQITIAATWSFNREYHPKSNLTEPPYPKEDVDFANGAYAPYNWELFFHIPMMIADRLSKEQKYEAAQRWYHFIFNPTNDSSDDASASRFWQLLPFKENTGPTRIKEWLDLLHSDDPEDEEDKDLMQQQISVWRKDPFNPHHIARLRMVAYQRNVVKKYLDNLIAWGDQLFRRDSIESINQATQLYVMALDLLGPRPKSIPRRHTREPKTYQQLHSAPLDEFSNALIESENDYNYIPYSKNSLKKTPRAFPNPSLQKELPPTHDLKYVYYFCIPQNQDLLKYWDTVEDRLFKIRHCMNIEGVVRQLPLYEPPIDPALLVRARAMGLDLASVLNDLSAPSPFYRFSYLQQKALELAQEVKSLGSSLLSVLEKKDAEALARMRSTHELDLLKSVREIKKESIKEAVKNKQALEQTKAVIQEGYEFYRDIEKRLPKESCQLDEMDESLKYQGIGQQSQVLADIFRALPNVGITVSVTGTEMTTTFGLSNAAAVADAVAKLNSFLASMHSQNATKASIEGGWERRWNDWKLQERKSAKELKQLDSQIAAADIRFEIAKKDLENHEQQIENSAEVLAFMKRKFTDQELYQWMSGQLSGIFFQSYQLAYDMAKRAEKAFQQELALPSADFIQFGYWDSLKKGLLSGERLALGLKRMESAYLEKNRREYELTKQISLRTLDPMALLNLKADGVCTVALPEVLFDMDYPGQYLRRIKSVSLTIPCVTGPYNNVNCKLTLLKSQIRTDPSVGGVGYPEDLEAEEGDARFVKQFGATQSIATSHAQNDSGMFELNFRDERYLPFEGAGAVSEWRIELDKDCNHFDFHTISDVVMHLRYTAREGGETLKSGAKENLNNILGALETTPLVRLISLKHEFPSEWHKVTSMSSPGVTLEIDRTHFPYLLAGKEIEIEESLLYLVPKVGSLLVDASVNCNQAGEDQWEIPLVFPIDQKIYKNDLEDAEDIAILLTYTIDI